MLRKKLEPESKFADFFGGLSSLVIMSQINMLKMNIELFDYNYRVVKNRQYNYNMPKLSQKQLCLKWTYILFGIDYRVA